jgi:hypothetical protein
MLGVMVIVDPTISAVNSAVELTKVGNPSELDVGLPKVVLD